MAAPETADEVNARRIRTPRPAEPVHNPDIWLRTLVVMTAVPLQDAVIPTLILTAINPTLDTLARVISRDTYRSRIPEEDDPNELAMNRRRGCRLQELMLNPDIALRIRIVTTAEATLDPVPLARILTVTTDPDVLTPIADDRTIPDLLIPGIAAVVIDSPDAAGRKVTRTTVVPELIADDGLMGRKTERFAAVPFAEHEAINGGRRTPIFADSPV